MKVYEQQNSGDNHNSQGLVMRKKYADLSIVQLSGGLGNQMFQYAFYRQLQALGKKVKMDDTTEYQYEGCRKPQLDVFGIQYDRCTREELVALTDAYMTPVDRVRRKLFGRKTRLYHEKQFNFNEEVFQLGSTYYEGCWQSEKYFDSIIPQLRDAFTFQCEIPQATQKYLDRIEQAEKQGIETVSIHIRRGDYLTEATQALYGNICTEEYYKKAIGKMKEIINGRKSAEQSDSMDSNNLIFYIFTNDIPWAEKYYQGAEYVIVDCNDESTGYLDMMLMSHCKHHIIANSSFSWWGAWLNQREDKIVLAPSKWLNGRDCSDIYAEQMRVVTDENR